MSNDNYLKSELDQRLQSDTALFDFLQAGSLDGIWYWDIEHPENEWMSPRFWELFGYDPETKKHLSSEWQEMIHPDDLQVALDNFHKHCADPNHPYDQVVRYRHRDGSTIWVRCRGIAIRDQSGKPIRMLGAHNDLTQAMQLQEELAHAVESIKIREHESRTLIENSPDTIARYNRECRRTYVNPAFGAMAKGGVAALLGKKPSEIPGGSDSEIYEEKINEVFATGKNSQFELKWLAKDGKEICSHIRLTAERDLSGNVVSVLGVGRDISELNSSRTELKQAEAALRKSEGRLEAMLQNMIEGMVTVDLAGQITYSNQAAVHILGLDKDISGKFFQSKEWRLLDEHGEPCPPDQLPLAIVLREQREVTNIEHQIIAPDGEYKWLSMNAAPLFDENGKLSGGIASFSDITKRKQVERSVAESEKKFRTLFDAISDAIFITDTTGRFLQVNRSACERLGYSQAELLQLGPADIDTPEFAAKVPERIKKLFERGNLVFESAHIRKDGTVIPIEINNRIIDYIGQPVILGLARDITERKKNELALTETMRQLREKELAKSRFLAAAGHDMRQPLTAANLFIDALKHTHPTAEQNRFIRHLDQAMSNFDVLLETLLNISKLDAGMIKPQLIAIDVADLFDWLKQSFAPLVEEKQLGFRFYFPSKKKLAVRGDIDLVKSVLMNLVSNAIKFTSKGAVLISARPRGSNVLFQIWDTGIGIQNEHIEHIFDEFYQSNNPQRDRTRGLGLGLSIAKRTLALFDGIITCRSKVGHGSVFEFCLPLDDSSSEMPHPETIPSSQEDAIYLEFVRGKRFVVLEDDALVAEALSTSLLQMNGKVRSFHNVEVALNHANIEDADYYIVDYMLGGTFNGIQFLEQLRHKPGKPIKAVVMTGDTSIDFVRTSTKCNWPVLHKPVHVFKLIAALMAQAH